MNDQQAREFVEMLAVPERTAPPACPLCGTGHALEARCDSAPRTLVSIGQTSPGGVAVLGDHRNRLDPVPAYRAA